MRGWARRRDGSSPGKTKVNYQEAKARSQVLKAVAHPTRVLLVDALRSGEKCVMELRRVADVDGSTISEHLNRLRVVGIVDCRKEGQRVFYRLENPCVLTVLDCAMRAFTAAAKRRNRLLKGA